MKSFILITALPFRRQGNQSMLRFVKMLLANQHKVSLFTTGTDENGEMVLQDPNFTFSRMHAFSYRGIQLLRKLLGRKQSSKVETGNYFSDIKSEDTLPPFGPHNSRTMLIKWARFLLMLADNIYIFLLFLFKYTSQLRKSDAIIGYEYDVAIASSWLSKLFGKKLITKYQGVLLKATRQNIGDCYRYYPSNYIGIVKTDLCIMVNDGTDGEFYARKKGIANVLFITHGVSVHEASGDNTVSHLNELIQNKLFIFNNASGSIWKRVDRAMRFINHLEPEVRANVIVLSTYFGPYASDLENYVTELGISDAFQFVRGLNGAQCYELILKSDALLMTNDLSNLGNPVLEALYSGKPVISLNDGSLQNVVEHGKNGWLLDIDANFDQSLADIVTRLYRDPAFKQQLQQGARDSKDVNVFSLQTQQNKEYHEIEKILR